MAQVATLSVVYLNTFWTGRNWSPLELLPFLCMHKAKSFQEELQLLRSQAVPWYLQLCQYLRAVPFAYLMVYLYSVTVELQHFRGFSPTLKPLGLVTFQLVATTPHWFGSHLDRASALNLENPLRFLSGFWFTLTFGGILWCVFFNLEMDLLLDIGPNTRYCILLHWVFHEFGRLDHWSINLGCPLPSQVISRHVAMPNIILNCKFINQYSSPSHFQFSTRNALVKSGRHRDTQLWILSSASVAVLVKALLGDCG